MMDWEILLSFALTWAAGIFAFGKIYGQLVSKMTNHEGRISVVENAFTGADGEPRILTKIAHDKSQIDCQRYLQRQIDDAHERIDKHDQKLDKILEGIADVRAAIGKGPKGGGVMAQ
jgi:ubiquitin C-terminal hydrolase